MLYMLRCNYFPCRECKEIIIQWVSIPPFLLIEKRIKSQRSHIFCSVCLFLCGHWHESSGKMRMYCSMDDIHVQINEQNKSIALLGIRLLCVHPEFEAFSTLVHGEMGDSNMLG